MSILAFIESNTTGTGRLFLRAARAERCIPVLIARDRRRYPCAQEEGVRVIEADTSDEAELIALLCDIDAEAGLAGITSTSDYFIATAARVAAHFGLAAPSPAAIDRCRDKARQHARLREFGVPVPNAISAGNVAQALAAAVAIGLPAVVKPAGGSGSVGVRLCRSIDEVEVHAATLLAQSANERGLAVRPAVLVQAFVEAREFSVETLAGEVIGITAKHVSAPPTFVELGHDFPASLGTAEARALADITRAAVAALDLCWGAAHTELRLGLDGPCVIEVNARLAGGFIPELIRRATGLDPIRELVRIVLARPVRRAPPLRGHASIRFLVPPRAGTLAAVEGVPAAAAVEGICDVGLYRAPGSPIALAGDFHDRIGHVIAAAASAEVCRGGAERALALLTPTIE
ncbi:ATP-grasp domain-containing protein [Sphingomonas sp. MMS12-HWE2-04]|uniref:ATP-grasp domain-containing protein n=1 Tax=Sphingomonas sp. MMS12-HWE2-04 TaxID=3234199 RepID=UPI00384DB21A